MAKTSMQIPSALIPIHAIKGRGAVGNMRNRFARDEREPFDDGWGSVDEAAPHGTGQAQSLPHPTTQVIEEQAKSVLTKNDSPDIPFDYSVNPYRGCEHGCVYCYARPTHSYLNLSPALDFETKIVAKMNVAEVLRRELQRPKYAPSLINLGSATDCYQPIERDLKLTRSVIQVLSDLRHPFAIVTKSAMIERDLDLIVPMTWRKLAAVYVTITTLDPKLARILEPRAAAPHRRLRLIETLAKRRVPVGVSVAPQIPFINEDMEQVLQAARQAGASNAFYSVIRLPWELSPIFRQWLGEHYPDRAERVMAAIQAMRGGQDYKGNWRSRMKGEGLWSDLIKHRFEVQCRRLGFNREHHLYDLGAFRRPVPVEAIEESLQAALF